MMQQYTVSVCNTVWRFAAVNLMTIALVIAGGGLFGASPAFAACLWAMSRSNELTTGQICRGMWHEWRAEFVRTNLVVLPVVSALTLLVIAIPFVHGFVLAALIVMILLASQLTLSALYVVSQVRCSVSDTFYNTTRVLMLAPARLLAALVIIPTLMIITISQPLFGLYGFFSVSAWSCIALFGAMHDPARRVLHTQFTQQEPAS